MRQPIAFLCDFDGTIGIQDTGELILTKLVFPRIAPDILTAINAQAAGSKELYSAWYSEAPPTSQEFEQLVSQAEIDPKFAVLCAETRNKQDAVAIVSDGFDAYIQRILGGENIKGIPVYSNRMDFNSKLTLSFPHYNPDCRFCGVCKAAVAKHYLRQGFYIVYIGDGVSDRFPVHVAHKVFAKDALVGICRQEGVKYTEFDSFQDILDWYKRGVLEQDKVQDLHTKCKSLVESDLGFLDRNLARSFFNI